MVRLTDDGKTVLESRIAKCPVCGGDIHIGQRTYNCANYRNESNPCKFSIRRNIGGHNVTVEEAREICEEGITQQTLEFYREDGGALLQAAGSLATEGPGKHDLVSGGYDYEKTILFPDVAMHLRPLALFLSIRQGQSQADGG